LCWRASWGARIIGTQHNGQCLVFAFLLAAFLKYLDILWPVACI
jgi:hypothetical protein